VAIEIVLTAEIVSVALENEKGFLLDAPHNASI
jgi:hypothetical protein